jgi:hypothetical protein
MLRHTSLAQQYTICIVVSITNQIAMLGSRLDRNFLTSFQKTIICSLRQFKMQRRVLNKRTLSGAQNLNG